MVYLDNSSTTNPCEKSVEYTVRCMRENWGNPSSLHTLGINAEIRMDEARNAVARVLHCRKEEIIFTGSGTEANNTAIFGAAKKNLKRGKRIVTTSIEHPSVLEAVKQLETQGFEVIYLRPNASGSISVKDIEAAVNKETVLVSIMLVNNETGAVQPVREAVNAVKRVGAPALVHTDAVQAFGKLPIDLTKLGVDLLTASAHKIHGPKGVGVLYVRRGVHIPPLVVGGGQEGGMRSGTESTPLISGLLGAIEELPNLNEQLQVQKELWQYAAKKLYGTGLVEINSDENCLPYILNISVLGYRSETLLHFLEAEDIFVSSGSACAKGEGSYVLREIGLDRRRVDSALRLSFSRFNTKEEIDILAEAIVKACGRLRKA